MIHPQDSQDIKSNENQEQIIADSNAGQAEQPQVLMSPMPQQVQPPAPFMTPSQEKQAYATAPAAAPAPVNEFLPSYSSIQAQPQQMMSPQPGYMHLAQPQSPVAQAYGYQPQPQAAGTSSQAYGYAQAYGVQQHQQMPVAQAYQPQGYGYSQRPNDIQFETPVPAQFRIYDGPVSVEDDEDLNHPDCRVGGFISAVLLALVWLFSMIAIPIFFIGTSNRDIGSIEEIIFIISCFLISLGCLLNFVFHIIVCVPGYVSGSPKVSKFIPALLGTFLVVSGTSSAFVYRGIYYEGPLWVPAVALLTPVLLSVFSYFSFMNNDKSGSFLKFFKTWTQKQSVDKVSI